ncbi:MAG: hypothetical protein KatS3mg087_1795 [Patescibacteria group bacterium]|nr:MAG: hypothetical protein KatS3mg087_1795 [Patescibacteria group bacterium]
MIRVGWLQDETYNGGAEISSQTLRQQAPSTVRITDIPAWQKSVEAELYDVFVVSNCTQYTGEIIQFLQRKPVVKVLWDMYPHGDTHLRKWLLSNAHLVAVTPKQVELLNLPKTTELMPSPIDYSAFKDYLCTQRVYDDNHMCYFGALFPHKLGGAIHYAEKEAKYLHVYGQGDWHGLRAYDHVIYHGALKPTEVPKEMSKYQVLVHMPTIFDPCPRVILEAWYLGLQVITNDMQGATWWIENDPKALFDAPYRFWDYVMMVKGKETDAN